MVACGQGLALMPELMFKEGAASAGCQVLQLEPCLLYTSDEIARTMVFLADEASGYITGQVLGVNGGPVSYTHLDVYKRQLPRRYGL